MNTRRQKNTLLDVCLTAGVILLILLILPAVPLHRGNVIGMPVSLAWSVGGAIGGAPGGAVGGVIGGALDGGGSGLSRAGRALKAGKGGLLGGLVSELASVGLGKLISECECE